MKTKIEDLRNHLFATIEGLLSKDDPLEIERAKAVADVAQVIINSAKVEVDYVRATNARASGSGFLPAEPTDAGEGKRPLLPAPPPRAALPPPPVASPERRAPAAAAAPPPPEPGVRGELVDLLTRLGRWVAAEELAKLVEMQAELIEEVLDGLAADSLVASRVTPAGDDEYAALSLLGARAAAALATGREVQ